MYTPSKTWLFGLTWVHSQNGISIDSAVYAQLTAESSYTLQWAAPSRLKIALFQQFCPLVQSV